MLSHYTNQVFSVFFEIQIIFFQCTSSVNLDNQFIQISRWYIHQYLFVLTFNNYYSFKRVSLPMMNFEEQPKISVAIRKRPLNKKEIQKNETDIVAVKNGETVIVSEYKQKVDLTKYIEENVFNFDFAFDQNINNEQIYLKAVRPLVESAFMKAKVTCFAYGQTGSGKTYTMNGDLANSVPGLYYLGANDIFELLKDRRFQHLKVQVSFFEIYCSRLFDLLNKRNQLKLREDDKGNVHIVGLEQKPLSSAKDFMTVIEYGSQFRVTSQNSTNADSSRSHAILQITLKEGKKVYGKISFIDLAGCERGADHMDQNKQTRIDGAEINKSLLSLKQCIRALDQGKGHTPFRGSKLTMVLKDSFVGFCRTVMIGNISPNINSCENTLNTLRYADRVKQLKKPNSNEQLSKQEQLAKELMLPRQNINAVKILLDKDDDAEDIQLKKEQAQKLMGVKNINSQPKSNSINLNYMFNNNLSQQQNIGGLSNTNNNYIKANNNSLNLNNKMNLLNNVNYNNNNEYPSSNSLVVHNNMNFNQQGGSAKRIIDANSNQVRKYSVEDKGPEKKIQQKNQLKKSFVNSNMNNDLRINILQDQKTVHLKNNINNNSFLMQQGNNYIGNNNSGIGISNNKPGLINTKNQSQQQQFIGKMINNNTNNLSGNQSNRTSNNKSINGNNTNINNNPNNKLGQQQPNIYLNKGKMQQQNNNNNEYYDDDYQFNNNKQLLQPKLSQQLQIQQQYSNPTYQQEQYQQQQYPYQNYQQYNNNQFSQQQLQFSQYNNNNIYNNNNNNNSNNNKQLKKANTQSFSVNINNNFNGQQNFRGFGTDSNQMQGILKKQPELFYKNIDSRYNDKNTRQFNSKITHSWGQLVEEFTLWKENSGVDLVYFQQVHEYMINMLMQEEDELTHVHSSFINKEIEHIREETKIIGEIQQNKEAYESLEYADFIQSTVDTKLNNLLELKKKVSLFKQHLMEENECQQKILRANTTTTQDQLLLQDLHQDYEEEQQNEYNNINYNDQFTDYNEEMLS